MRILFSVEPDFSVLEGLAFDTEFPLETACGLEFERSNCPSEFLCRKGEGSTFVVDKDPSKLFWERNGREYAVGIGQVRGYVIVLHFAEATSNCYDSTYYNIDAYTLKILLTI